MKFKNHNIFESFDFELEDNLFSRVEDWNPIRTKRLLDKLFSKLDLFEKYKFLDSDGFLYTDNKTLLKRSKNIYGKSDKVLLLEKNLPKYTIRKTPDGEYIFFHGASTSLFEFGNPAIIEVIRMVKEDLRIIEDLLNSIGNDPIRILKIFANFCQDISKKKNIDSIAECPGVKSSGDYLMFDKNIADKIGIRNVQVSKNLVKISGELGYYCDDTFRVQLASSSLSSDNEILMSVVKYVNPWLADECISNFKEMFPSAINEAFDFDSDDEEEEDYGMSDNIRKTRISTLFWQETVSKTLSKVRQYNSFLKTKGLGDSFAGINLDFSIPEEKEKYMVQTSPHDSSEVHINISKSNKFFLDGNFKESGFSGGFNTEFQELRGLRNYKDFTLELASKCAEALSRLDEYIDKLLEPGGKAEYIATQILKIDSLFNDPKFLRGLLYGESPLVKHILPLGKDGDEAIVYFTDNCGLLEVRITGDLILGKNLQCSNLIYDWYYSRYNNIVVISKFDNYDVDETVKELSKIKPVLSEKDNLILVKYLSNEILNLKEFQEFVKIGKELEKDININDWGYRVFEDRIIIDLPGFILIDNNIDKRSLFHITKPKEIFSGIETLDEAKRKGSQYIHENIPLPVKVPKDTIKRFNEIIKTFVNKRPIGIIAGKLLPVPVSDSSNGGFAIKDTRSKLELYYMDGKVFFGGTDKQLNDLIHRLIEHYDVDESSDDDSKEIDKALKETIIESFTLQNDSFFMRNGGLSGKVCTYYDNNKFVNYYIQLVSGRIDFVREKTPMSIQKITINNVPSEKTTYKNQALDLAINTLMPNVIKRIPTKYQKIFLYLIGIGPDPSVE